MWHYRKRHTNHYQNIGKSHKSKNRKENRCIKRRTTWIQGALIMFGQYLVYRSNNRKKNGKNTDTHLLIHKVNITKLVPVELKLSFCQSATRLSHLYYLLILQASTYHQNKNVLDQSSNKILKTINQFSTTYI